MPRLVLLLGVLLSFLPAAANNLNCPHCDTLARKSVDLIVVPRTKGDWYIAKQTTYVDSCDSAAGTAEPYQVRGTSRIVHFLEKLVAVDPGISSEQATLAYQHPDSLTSATLEFCNAPWLEKSLRGIIYHTGRGKTIIRAMQNAGISWDMLICFLAIIVFSLVYAFVLPKSRWSENAFSSCFCCAFAVVLGYVLTREAMIIYQTATLSWPIKLLLMNFGGALVFIAFFLKPTRELIKIFFKRDYRFKTRTSIRDLFMPLGSLTLFELIFFAFITTKSLLTTLCYLGVIAGSLLLAALIPLTIKYVQQWKISRKKKPA